MLVKHTVVGVDERAIQGVMQGKNATYMTWRYLQALADDKQTAPLQYIVANLANKKGESPIFSC
ncbi:CIC11C00000004776 [Sungouiella intermedia]|uniref:CIC11C00000004776 n=1 Tax=Sungouiella intermedia TaxID=45354 RepID=A0A1L0C5T1_9ASCO|nr:CIC11C00000004776 [[Candida] intermedia]